MIMKVTVMTHQFANHGHINREASQTRESGIETITDINIKEWHS